MNGDPQDIRAWQRLDSRVTTSGLLAPADFARLATIGVRHIVSLALPDSPGIPADEPALCHAHRMCFINIPIPFATPEHHHYTRFRDTLDRLEGSVHVHCVMNWRVSACFYRLHRERGMPEPRARALMTQHWDPATSDHPDAPAWAAFIGAPD